jgi:ribonuclease BN (tRNA processing enzyme)
MDDRLTVTVLGCAGSYPGPGNACSGYLVRSDGATVVVDLGSGTLANLQRHVTLDEVDALVLTHEHPDHWSDVPILRNALRYYLGVEDLPVYGTSGVLAQARALISELEPTLRWTTLDAGSTVEIGDQRLRFSRTDHPVETLAVRIDAGERTLAYTADTGSGWTPGDFLAGADLLLCEATMSEAHEDRAQHLTGRQAGALARAAGIPHLVLTHIAPGVDPTAQVAAAQGPFGGSVTLATPDAVIAV